MAPHWVKHPEDLVTWFFCSLLDKAQHEKILLPEIEISRLTT